MKKVIIVILFVIGIYGSSISETSKYDEIDKLTSEIKECTKMLAWINNKELKYEIHMNMKPVKDSSGYYIIYDKCYGNYEINIDIVLETILKNQLRKRIKEAQIKLRILVCGDDE